ncbi:MAG: FG-GAP repeat protein [Bryobacteraceae bacterium]
MRSRRRGFHRARTLLALLAICAGALVGETAPPAGVSAADWSAIRAEYERHRHSAVAEAGGYKMRNPGQQWMTHFDRRGFTVRPGVGDGAGWTWGLELESWGFAGQMVRASEAQPRADGNRIRYRRGDGVQEWFVNDVRGLEQGFTLLRRPAGEGLLAFDLAVRGGLEPRLSGDSVGFIDGSGAQVVRYSGLKAWDAAGKVLPTRFELAGRRVRMTVDERGAVYPVTVDPLVQMAYLKASNTGSGDGFGYSVAVSIDTVVVGAHLEDSIANTVNGDQANNSATDSGAAYVFTRDRDGAWFQVAYLKASNSASFKNFGYSVAISGDTIVVGAPNESGSGAAYVFIRFGGEWSLKARLRVRAQRRDVGQQAYLKASNAAAGDLFGVSVAASEATRRWSGRKARTATQPGSTAMGPTTRHSQRSGVCVRAQRRD